MKKMPCLQERIVLNIFLFCIVLTESTKYVFGDRVACSASKEFKLLLADTVLANAVIANYQVTSQAECLLYCYENERCLSYNYQYTLHNSGKLGLCEINNTTIKSCRNLRKIHKAGHGYFDQINVDKIHSYGSKTNPGKSCMDIKNCQNNNVDGEFWVYSQESAWKTVKVFCFMDVDKEKNLAQGKPATQHSTSYNAVATKAVDGDRISDFFQSSCTHTSTTTSPWWRVDLQKVYFIRKLIITNRSDCCSERLSDFEIKIGLSVENNGNSNPSCGGKYTALGSGTKTIECPRPMIGRYVNIIIPGAGKTLTLCEVEVYA